MNGIGGSGDFARNAYIAMFLTPSTAKSGAISSIVPMVSHVRPYRARRPRHTSREWGVADLRGLAPRRRAQKIIDNCAHPITGRLLQDYSTPRERYVPRQTHAAPDRRVHSRGTHA